MVKGIVRHVDELGRIVVPKEIRKSLRIKETDLLDIYLRDGVLCMEKVSLSCVCCGLRDEEQLLVHNGVHVCQECLGEFSKEGIGC